MRCRVWIVAAASSAVSPCRSVQARVSLSPAVKNVSRPSASNSRRTTSSSAEGPSRNAAASSSGSSASSASSLRSIPPGPFTTGDDRLRRQRLELRRQLALPVAQRPRRRRRARAARSRSARPPARSRASPDFACFAHPLEPPLDVVAVGDEQLELERLEVSVGIGSGREAVRDGQQRVDLTQVAEQLRRPCPARRRRAIAAGVTLRGPDDLRDPRRAARPRSAPSRRAPCRSPAPTPALRQRVEERRLPGRRQADDPDLERHA